MSIKRYDVIGDSTICCKNDGRFVEYRDHIHALSVYEARFNELKRECLAWRSGQLSRRKRVGPTGGGLPVYFADGDPSLLAYLDPEIENGW